MGLENRPKAEKDPKGKVNVETCDNIRKAAHNKQSVSEIVENIELNISDSSVRYHIHGECSHDEESKENTVKPISREDLSINSSINNNGESIDWNGKFKKGRNTVQGEPEVSLYPCGDIRFNVHAVQQWNINAWPGAEIFYNIRTCEIWIFFKQDLKNYYNVDHSKTNDYSARIQSNDGLLNKLRINKPEERIVLDHKWISDNNVLYLDLLPAA